MIDCIIETHWRTVASVNPGYKIQSDIENTRISRFSRYELRPIQERIDRRNKGRYPINVIVEEIYD